MKRLFLLLVCALPCLLYAYNAPVKNVLKDKSSIQRVLKRLPAPKQNKAVATYSSTADNLPDSVYEYSDEAKTKLVKKTYFKYNDLGLPLEEKWIDFSERRDDSSMDDEFGRTFKTEYVYTENDGIITVEQITYVQNQAGVWEIFDDKIVYMLNESDLVNPIEIFAYYFDEEKDEWILTMKAKAVAFDAGNRPTVYEAEWILDDEDLGIFTMASRLEFIYNEHGLVSSETMFFNLDDIPYYTGYDPDDPWFLMQKQDFFYNASLQLIKEVFYEYYFDDPDYVSITTTEYKYDDRGNINYMYFFFGDDEDYSYESFFTNFYPDGTGNEVVFSVQSAIYPNPVSDVLVVSIKSVGEAVISLVSLNGSIVYQQKTNQPITSIPVKSFEKGPYFLLIQSGKQTKSHKVLIR